jgi:hypothetical protein
LFAVNDPQHLQNLASKTPREIVRLVNLDVVARARRFVWAADRSQATFIRKHMSTKLEPTPFLSATRRWSMSFAAFNFEQVQ